MDRFELQKLRDLPIEGVAERLGLYVSHHKCLCPFHDDHHASLSFHIGRNTFRCFVCDAKGGTIDLVMRHLGKNFKEACQWLSNGELDSSFKIQDSSNLKRETWNLKPFDASRYEKYFEHPFLNEEARKFLFDERRLDPRVVRWCRLTSWKDKQGVPWLQIPYYNCEGKLVGIQNRNLIKGALPRFRFPQGSQCGIYNLPVLNLLKPGDELYIAEGCSDCWSLLSAGHKAIAIPSATLLSKKDVELLQAIAGSKVQGVQLPSPRRGAGGEANSSLGITFHMWPDRDEPGERLFLQLQKVLPSLVHHQLPPTCKDFSEYYLNLNRRSSESHSSLLGNGRVASEDEQSSNMEPET